MGVREVVQGPSGRNGSSCKQTLSPIRSLPPLAGARVTSAHVLQAVCDFVALKVVGGGLPIPLEELVEVVRADLAQQLPQLG